MLFIIKFWGTEKIGKIWTTTTLTKFRKYSYIFIFKIYIYFLFIQTVHIDIPSKIQIVHTSTMTAKIKDNSKCWFNCRATANDIVFTGV